ncbi:MAG: hypothetical protein ACRD4F_19105, partial [Candidatus Angelobacter sp.]
FHSERTPSSPPVLRGLVLAERVGEQRDRLRTLMFHRDRSPSRICTRLSNTAGSVAQTPVRTKT